MSNADADYAFIVLLNDSDDANGLARLLEDVRIPDAATTSLFAAPPVRGLDFFADDASQAELDQWWGENVGGNAVPVYLLNHEDQLNEWVEGLDGTFYIGLPNPELTARYASSPQIRTFVAGGPLDFATQIMRDFSGGAPAPNGGEPVVIFDPEEALRMAALSSDFPIDLDDSAFDFSDPPPPPVPTAPYGAPGQQFSPFATPFPAPPGGAPFNPSAPQPFSPFATPPLAAPGQPSMPQPAPRRRDVEPATAHPFDLVSGAPPTPSAPAAPSPPTWPPAPAPAPPAAPAPRPQPASTTQPSPLLTPPPAPMPSPAPQKTSQRAPSAPPRDAGRPMPKSLPEAIAPALSKLTGGLGIGRGKPQRTNFVETPTRELAQLIVDRGPTIVVMGSRKGGVGKTSYAAGISIAVGAVLDTVGHKAAIVDANIANPDAWGQMNLREGAATVRDVVAALTANHEPPPPVHSTTPALAVYPESRETTEYSKTDIKRFADYLRRRYTFIVVDMTNRLPDPMAGPEAAAAAYWLEHADVLVLPTTSSKQDFNGVLDFLDVRNLPPTVVPYIVPSVKRNREHPVTKQYLNVIRERVHRIVEIPDEADTVRFAGMEGVPVEQVSPALRAAYRELTEVVVRVPPRARVQ